MTKIFACLCASTAYAASVNVHQHFSTEEPNALLENMRALAKKAQEKKIEPDVLTAVATLVSDMRAKVDEGIECIARDQNILIVNHLATLTEINNKLAFDVDAVADSQAAIKDNHNSIVGAARNDEDAYHEWRCDACDEVCDTLIQNPPCVAPEFPDCDPSDYPCDWLEDPEPCGINDYCPGRDPARWDPTDPNPTLRGSKWQELDAYMACMDDFMADNGPYEQYLDASKQCQNASTSWRAEKQSGDTGDDSVSREICQMIEDDKAKCLLYNTNWISAKAMYDTDLALAKDLIANGFAQHEAMRKIECLFTAIKEGNDGSRDITEACAECEAEPLQCVDVCPYSNSTGCSLGFQCEACCDPAPPRQPCDELDVCEPCTADFRHEYFDCPDPDAPDVPASGALCKEDATGKIVTHRGEEIEDQCKLLVKQLSCTARFSCEDECDKNADGSDKYMPDGRRAYYPFTCGGDSIDNMDFVNRA